MEGVALVDRRSQLCCDHILCRRFDGLGFPAPYVVNE
jgi:hypothetical protein